MLGGLKTPELIIILLIIAIVAAVQLGHKASRESLVEESELKRLGIYALMILISTVVLWNLVEHRH